MVVQLKNLLDEDFSNYKLPAMFIGFPKCTFKCEKESGTKTCQNSSLAVAPNVDISIDDLLKRYQDNGLSQAVVCGGLEPLDTFNELYAVIKYFRDNGEQCKFVIYTGYYPDEVMDKIGKLVELGNIVVKYGRFIPNDEKRYDEVLGVTLASKNQYAVEY